MPANPTVDAANTALVALEKKDFALFTPMFAALLQYSDKNAGTSAKGKTAANAQIMKLAAKGDPYKGWAAAFQAVLALPPATIRDAGGIKSALPSHGAGEVIGGAVDSATGVVQDALTPSWAGGIIGALTSANTWLRVGEVVLGLLLVVAGVVKLAGPTVLNATPAGRIAKAVK
jgi:hypothetical protein